MAAVINPTDLAVLPDDPVLDVVHIFIRAFDLMVDLPLHPVQILRVDHPPEGAAHRLHKFVRCAVAKDFHHRRAGIEEPLAVHSPVDEKAVRHAGQGLGHLLLPLFLILLDDVVDAAYGDHGCLWDAALPLTDGDARHAPLLRVVG